MTAAERLSEVEATAAEVNRKYGLLKPRVCPFRIARGAGLEVYKFPFDADTKASGVLILTQGRMQIGYNARQGNAGYHRYSVAHELGHYFLDGHVDEIGTPSYAMAGRSPLEKEADAFAAALLMPRAKFDLQALDAPAGLRRVEILRDTFDVSFSAAAYRLVNSDNPELAVCVVESRHRKITSFWQSSSFRARVGLPFLRNQRIPQNSHTEALRLTGGPERSRCDTISAAAWGGKDKGISLTEEALNRGNGRILTLLTYPAFDPLDFDIWQRQRQATQAFAGIDLVGLIDKQ